MPTIGEQLRHTGIEANLAAALAPQRSFREHAELILGRLCRQGRQFTVDDVRQRIPDGIEPHSPNVLPSLIRLWSSRGAIEPVGWVRSNRASRHASVNRIWRGTGCAVD